MTTPQRLAGRLALVTGATSGIGRAVAVQLARQGATVLVHGRDAARGTEVIKGIERSGGRARFIAADIGNADEIPALVAEVGDIDILVNNAGFSWFGPTPELSAGAFDDLFDANVRAPYLLTAAFAPAMVAKGTGNIVSIAEEPSRLRFQTEGLKVVSGDELAHHRLRRCLASVAPRNHWFVFKPRLNRGQLPQSRRKPRQSPRIRLPPPRASRSRRWIKRSWSAAA